MGANKTAAPLQHRVDRRRERLTPLAETIRLAAGQDEQAQQTTDPVDHGSPNARERWHRVSAPRCFTHSLAPTGKNHTMGATGCCARAASGHPAAPPSVTMNSRRPIWIAM